MATPSIICIADQGSIGFEYGRLEVSIVCAGDSLTGWNNNGPLQYWPFPTYPDVLQKLCEPLGLRVANGGIAGEVSDNGPKQVRDYVKLFPNARYFVVGMGTNDLAIVPDTATASRGIINNLDQMAQIVLNNGMKPILFNVPHVNEAVFPGHMVEIIRGKREYHNPRLRAFCADRGIPLADVCSRLSDNHFGDSLHPNAEGAQIIAATVFKVLNVN
ncbi:MAG: SGNH/GDSL hydrolase family protein [Schlesneria sp.]